MKNRESKVSKAFIICVAFFGGLLVLIVGGAYVYSLFSPPESKSSNPSSSPSLIQSPIVSYNIDMRNEIVKKVGNVYRYFFFITNNDSHPFDATVEIGLIEANGIQITFEDFTPEKPIQPQMSQYCYVDARWGPPGISKNAIEKFTWRVIVNSQTIQSGSGNITTRYEDASY